MKKLMILVMLSYSLFSNAQGFKVVPTDKDVDVSSLKKPQVQLPAAKTLSHSYLSPEQRDEVLSKYIPEELKKMDESDKDILYKSLLQYDSKRLETKYPFLKKVKLDELKKSL